VGPMMNNPAFLSDAELARAFVVRHVDLELMLETIRENTADSRWHVLLVGQRGMGKTTLMRRLALAVRGDAELSRRWYPVVYSEESYEVLSAGEFWLKALFHLGVQTQEAKWQEIHDELLAEPDEERLCEAALKRIVEFAREWNVRILLVAENLDMIFGQQLDEEAAWKVRRALDDEPAITLVGTAMGRFDAIDGPDKPFSGLFEFQQLAPLDRDSCRTLWNALTDWDLGPTQIRPLQILTGGNPRLLTILSGFAQGRNFHALMDELPRLIDERTSYFKASLDALPAYERKVFVSLADIWAPATAREVAAQARMDVNRTSALLRRLVTRGMVTDYRRKGRKIWYQVTERLFNVFHLMRRRGGAAIRVHALVDFMVCFYGDRDDKPRHAHLFDELRQILDVRLDEESDARFVLERAVGEKPNLAPAWGGLVYLAVERADEPADMREILNRGIRTSHGDPAVMNEMAWELFRSGRADLLDDATALARLAVDRAPDVSEVHHTLASIFAKVDRWEDSLDVARSSLKDPTALGAVTADLVDFFIEAAVAGHAAGAIDTIRGTPCEVGLEPVLAALEQDVGEDVVAPQEVREVAQDVIRKIQDKRIITQY
jgi:hypothetical protein